MYLKDRNAQRLPLEEVCAFKGVLKGAKCPLEWAPVVLLRQRNALRALGLPCLPRSLGLLDSNFS